MIKYISAQGNPNISLAEAKGVNICLLSFEIKVKLYCTFRLVNVESSPFFPFLSDKKWILKLLFCFHLYKQRVCWQFSFYLRNTDKPKRLPLFGFVFRFLFVCFNFSIWLICMKLQRLINEFYFKLQSVILPDMFLNQHSYLLKMQIARSVIRKAIYHYHISWNIKYDQDLKETNYLMYAILVQIFL